MDVPKMVESVAGKENESVRGADLARFAKVNIEWVSQNRLRITMAKVNQ